MFGPWEKIADGYGKMVLGYFGKTPVPPDPKVVEIAAQHMGLEPTTKTPLEINDADPNKGLAPAKERLEEEGLPTTDENIFIAAACKEKGIDYLMGNAKLGIRKIEPAKDVPSAGKEDKYTVAVGDKSYQVELATDKAVVNGKTYDICISEGIDDSGVTKAASTAEDSTPVKAAVPGTVLGVNCEVGDIVTEGDLLLVLEAMKMEIKVKSPAAGQVTDIEVKKGDQVKTGQLLVSLL
jgi:pyruvate carboxylase subunit B